jgi:(p)ppGpp synthase/HD superfamily hydrolase
MSSVEAAVMVNRPVYFEGMIEKAEQLARRWMPGLRQGPAKRKAWEHPQDLVSLLTKEMDFIETPAEEQEKRVAVAWLHDILEDGKKEDGTTVSVQDLCDEGIRPQVIADVLALTNEGPKDAYLAQLKAKSPRAKLVKCVDRICNLREGKDAFKTKRWIRYVGETYYFIFPLTEGLPPLERNFLRQELIKAVEARQLGAAPYFGD